MMNSPHNVVLKQVRKIKPGNRSITGKRPSVKTNKSQAFESSLERDYLTLLEFDHVVESYIVQPVTIQYFRENKSARYTPDVAVYYLHEFNRKPLLVEIKYEAELLEKKTLLEPKFNAATTYALEKGFEFKVVTEKEIRTDYLENIKFLSNYRRASVDERIARLILEQFERKDQLTPQALLRDDDNESKAELLYTLWQLVASKLIICDMQQKISMTSILWKKEN